MLLSDRDLRTAIIHRRLTIEPYEIGSMQASSIDMRLDRHLLAWGDGGVIDPAGEQEMLPVEILDGDTYTLHPGQMVLGSTLEHVELSNDIACRLEGKSSIGRLGIAIHVTAGWIDAGFRGYITLEIVNHAPRPVLLYPGMRIGQLCAFSLSSPARHPYGSRAAGSHYQDQKRGPTPSRAWQNWRTWPTTTASERTRP